jgi:hypothetical protein
MFYFETSRARISGMTGEQYHRDIREAEEIRSYPFVYCYAALSASKRARAFFPSLAASAMLSKKTDERSIGVEQQAR